jgi:hypothetical protein
MLVCVPLASAQSSFDLNVGLGTAHLGANGGGLENGNSTQVAAGTACTVSSAEPSCQATPSLGGVFLGLGGDLMLRKHYGIGMEFAVQPVKSDYALLQFRQTFYDINGIYAPVSEKRVQLQLQGGIGGARTSFSYTQSNCVGTAVCSTQSSPVGNANHFQVHVGVGLQLYLTEHIFVRPQFDLHVVPNFDQQFGGTRVPAGTVWVGYSFGDRS